MSADCQKMGILFQTMCNIVVFSLTTKYVLGLVYPEDIESVKDLFRSWKLEHQKEYHVGEEFRRFHTFHDNVRLINKLNNMYKGQTLFDLNKFADLSPEEFRRKMLMPKRPVPFFEKERYITSKVINQLPDAFDWTLKNVVTSVKDQGAGGTCWAFSTVENIEGQWALSGRPLTNLSVEQVVECDNMEDLPRQHADCGVFGGWPYLAYEYVIKAGGLSSWEDYPYCSGDTSKSKSDNCDPCPPPGFNSTLCGPPTPWCNMSQSCVAKLDKTKFVNGLKVQGWKAIDQNETVIAEQLMKIGPLSVTLDADWLMFYHSGVFDPFLCSSKTLDHAVLLVGFGKEKTLLGEKLYWKVKNSWGSSWGENGYFRIKRNSGTCGINQQVTTSVLIQ